MARLAAMTTGDLDSLLARGRTRRRLPEPAVRRLLRERARLSQGDLAEVMGVDRATVSRWETGVRTPAGNTLTTYVELLDRLAAER